MKPIILDVDTGIDDALAIAYAVHSPELEILGLTTCFGNVTVEEATRNTLTVLDYLDADIPVYPGANVPFLRKPLKKKAVHIHGEDGIGNTLTGEPKRKAMEDHAAKFIIEQIRQRPGEVTVICVGALTNLVQALLMDPGIARLVDRVVIMGGAVTVPGNVTPAAEANIYTDPDAAEFVFRSGAPVTLVGLDVTMQTCLPQTELQAWRNTNTPLGSFMADMTEFYMSAYKRFNPQLGGCALHDPLAVGVVIDPTFVRTVPMYVKVDCGQADTVGRTTGESRDERASDTVDVCLEVDADRFLAHFMSRVV
jgi:purine nucleosidase